MMIQKALLFGDDKIAEQMLRTTDPKQHKALGRRVRNFDAKTWDANKLRIVTEATYHKFTISSDAARLRTLLLATGESELVEASPFDRVWGIGFTERDAEASRLAWGENLLGRALMDVRRRLREEEEEKVRKEGKGKQREGWVGREGWTGREGWAGGEEGG